MTDRVFVDTNVFVYAFVTDGSDKHMRAKRFLEDLGGSITISTQVLNELYVALLKYGCPDSWIQEHLKRLSEDLKLIPVNYSLIAIAWDIRNKLQFSLWDSLIIAAAQEADCDVLYTEDLQHGQCFEDRLRVINPFVVN